MRKGSEAFEEDESEKVKGQRMKKRKAKGGEKREIGKKRPKEDERRNARTPGRITENV